METNHFVKVCWGVAPGGHRELCLHWVSDRAEDRLARQVEFNVLTNLDTAVCLDIGLCLQGDCTSGDDIPVVLNPPTPDFGFNPQRPLKSHFFNSTYEHELTRTTHRWVRRGSLPNEGTTLLFPNRRKLFIQQVFISGFSEKFHLRKIKLVTKENLDLNGTVCIERPTAANVSSGVYRVYVALPPLR